MIGKDKSTYVQCQSFSTNTSDSEEEDEDEDDLQEMILSSINYYTTLTNQYELWIC